MKYFSDNYSLFQDPIVFPSRKNVTLYKRVTWHIKMSDIIDKSDPAPGPPSPAGITPRTSVKDLQGDPTNPSNQPIHLHSYSFILDEKFVFYILLGHLLWTIRLNFFSYRH